MSTLIYLSLGKDLHLVGDLGDSVIIVRIEVKFGIGPAAWNGWGSKNLGNLVWWSLIFLIIAGSTSPWSSPQGWRVDAREVKNVFRMFHRDILKGVRTEPVRNLRHIDHQNQPEVGKVMYGIRDIPWIGRGLCHLSRPPLYFRGRRLQVHGPHEQTPAFELRGGGEVDMRC